jgi:hypothetical protein
VSGEYCTIPNGTAAPGKLLISPPVSLDPADERVDVVDPVRHKRGLLGVRRARSAGQHHAANHRR